MPKRQAQRIIDNRSANRNPTTISGITLTSPGTAYTAGAGLTLTGVVLAVGAGDGISVAADAVAVDSTVVRTTRTVTAGSGLTGGGALSADLTLNVGAGTLITVGADTVGITAGANYQYIGTGSDTTPEWRNVSELAGNGLTATNGVLAVGVANTGATGLSVEADAIRLTTSSNPGAAASVLASDASGYLTLVRLSTSDRLRSPILDTAAGNLTIQPAADIVLDPAGGRVRLAANRTLQSDNYASQTTGMRLTYAGEGDFRYLFTDELHAKSFIADLEQALAGGQIISKSVAVLASAFTAPAPGATATLVVRDLPSAPNMACFQAGDIVRLRTFSRAAGSLSIADCWGTVTGYADQTDGTQTWTFTRSTAPNAGAMAAGTVIAADAIVLDYGTSGNGFYEVNAVDGAYGLNSPYAQIVSWTTHPATGQTVRSRLGNLRGIFGASNEYGLYAGAGTATSDAYLRISNTEVGLYNLPLRMYTGGTERVHIGAHNDVWIGPSSADKRLSWDGSTLTVKGAIVVQAGSSGIGSFSDANIDNIADGATYRRTTLNEKTGAARAYAALDSSNILTTRVDPGANWGANPGAGVAGLLLGADYMGYWTGSAWRSYMDNAGRFYLNAGAGSNYLSWDGSTLTINGSINVTGGNAATLDNVTGAINLVANASFEADTNSDGLADGFIIYNNDGGAVPTVATRVAGSKSTWAQRIAWTGTNASTKGIIFNTGTRRANTDYVITFWARTSHAVALGFSYNVPPASHVNLLWPTAGTAWQFYAARLQWSSANSDNWYLSIAWSAAITNGWIEFDNVQVIEGSEIVPWSVAPADKANTSLDNSVISTLISGANIRVGSGTKDVNLNGWNIDATEIVGQAAGVDQVVLNSSGQILAGAGQVGLWSSGIGLSFPTNDTFTSTQRISFLRSTLTGTEQGYIGARTFSSGQDFQLEIVGLGYGSSWGSIKLVGSTTTAGAVSSNAGAVVVQAGNVFVPYRGLIVHDDFATYGTTIAASGSLLAKTLVVTGAVGYDWSNLTLATGWTNYNTTDWASFGVKRFGDMVSIKGLVRATSNQASGSVLYTLPSEYRPARHRMFNVRTSDAAGSVRVDVQSDGKIIVQSAINSNEWVSLEITYFTGG